MGPGFELIADRFCRAAIAVKEQWPLPPRSVRQLLRRRGDGWTEGLAAAVRDIDACIYEYLVAERRRDFAGAGLVKMLVDGSRAQGDEFNDRSLRDQILTVFFAGHETTATSLSWIHYLLDRNPDARRKLRAEVDEVLGGRAPTNADLDRLKYTEQVVNEALRLYSPIHSLSRVALEDDTLGGYHIPAGATIYVSLYATHRLPSLWPDPDRFDPGALYARQGRGPAALRLHSVRCGSPQLRRREPGHRRAQDRRRDDRAALRAHAGAGPTRRGRGRHHDASALWHEHADPGTLTRMSETKPSAGTRHSDYYDRAADEVPQFTVLNYGFSSEPESSVIAGE